MFAFCNYLGGDWMLPVFRDEILTRPIGADFTLQIHGKSNCVPARRDSFPPGICLDLYTFPFNFSL